MDTEIVQRDGIISRLKDYTDGVIDLIPFWSVLKVAGLVIGLGVAKATLEYTSIDESVVDLFFRQAPAITQGAIGGISGIVASHMAFSEDTTKRERQVLFPITVGTGLAGGYYLSLLETTIGYEAVHGIVNLF